VRKGPEQLCNQWPSRTEFQEGNGRRMELKGWKWEVVFEKKKRERRKDRETANSQPEFLSMNSIEWLETTRGKRACCEILR